MNKRLVVMLIGTGIVFGAIFGFKAFGLRMMNEAMDNQSLPAPTVSTAIAEEVSWGAEISAVGGFSAVQGTELATESSGIVDSISFESGARVKKGDVLITLTSLTARAELDSLKADARLAAQELKRVERLVEKKVMAKSELDRRVAELESARAKAIAQGARLSTKTLKAPFDGALGIRRVSLGQYLAAGTPVVSLQSLSPIYLDFSLPEQRIADVQPGLPVVATGDAFPDRSFTGKIHAVSATINPDTRNFEVQAIFDNPDQLLKPGMFAHVRIKLPAVNQRLIVVPQTAISYSPYGNSLYVVARAAGDESVAPRVKRRFVKTGVQRGDLVAIDSGLQAGEEVVTSGLLKLQNDIEIVVDNEVLPDASVTPDPEEG